MEKTFNISQQMVLQGGSCLIAEKKKIHFSIAVKTVEPLK